MAELRTEEEQLEAIKRWWKDNGTSLIAGVAIAAAGVFGWNAWQNHQDNRAEAASQRYQEMVSLTASDSDDEAVLAQARALATEINDEYDGTLYAELAQLLDARLAVQQQDIEGATRALEQVADTSSRLYVQSLARLRLARLAIARDEPQEALSLLDQSIVDTLAAQRDDLRGDAHFALDQHEDARDAWQNAMTLAQQRSQPLYGVQLKLDDLGTREPAL